MAPQRPLLGQSGQMRAISRAATRRAAQSCPKCTVAAAPARPTLLARKTMPSPRYESTSKNARLELQNALNQLNKHLPNAMNLSRLQLALQGLQKPAGQEIIRIAVLGLGDTTTVARKLLRAILSDPLTDEQPWETQLDGYDPNVPLVVRVGPTGSYGSTLEFARHNPVEELHISSPQFNNLNLEFLVLNVNAVASPTQAGADSAVEEAILVPSVDIASAQDRVSPMTTPVHQAIVVGENFGGAVQLANLPIAHLSQSIIGAVDMPKVTTDQLHGHFKVVDVTQAQEAVRLFRQGPQNAVQYEKLWFASNLPTITTWLRQSSTSPDHQTKPAMKHLLTSLVESANASVKEQEAALQAMIDAPKMSDAVAAAMEAGLSDWSRAAHAELQSEMDKAFAGRRWRKLGWWKLFWRVDDVGMLTNDILSQRFLPTSENNLIYLAGRIAEQRGSVPLYSQPVSETSQSSKEPTDRTLTPLAPKSLPRWPGHIGFTRRYLQDETIPALQALAQRLVVQSLGTSTISATLAGLLYVSSFSTTFYEVGAVAALGIVYGLGRMQKKWEAAREYWEGEVREEGRKAVRGTEQSVIKALSSDAEIPEHLAADISAAKELVEKATDALSKMK